MGKGPGPKGENDYGLSITSPPPGWRLPNRKDFEALINQAGSNTKD